MNRIQILDCTLRDGGYCNQWNFGKENISQILQALSDADIDIIECGFVTNRIVYHENQTKFSSLSEIETILPKNRADNLFVCMINFGEYQLEDIPQHQPGMVDGIRVAFHKKDYIEAISFCNGIKKKGYYVFLQPMVSLNYSDEEFIQLIRLTNEFLPYAFYIVDSFGGMSEKEVLHFFGLLESNLLQGIKVGFHSHNNMQLAFANSKALMRVHSHRNLIIDSCVLGMGRGAGNLNTELLLEEVNDFEGTKYHLEPVLTVIDEILNAFFEKKSWGYSLPNYLSARYNIHPNYTKLLVDKGTLFVHDMNEIFCMMEEEKKVSYDQLYMERLYEDYMEQGKQNEKHMTDFKNLLKNRKILIVAPGKSIQDEQDKIQSYIQDNEPIIISINFSPENIESKYIFVSNRRRFAQIDKRQIEKCILTSNIAEMGGYMKVNYATLLNHVQGVSDNAGLLLIQFLFQVGVKKVEIAGMDGYSLDGSEDYADSNLNGTSDKLVIIERNKGMEQVLKEYAKKMEINFITKSRIKISG